MDLEVRHLRLVEAIAEEGTMTRAALRLHLTQSALSHQLRDVEERLGARLFLRMKRRMIPTPPGERLLESARKLLSELQRTEDAIRRAASGQEGILRLSTECYTCYHWLPARLERFRRKFPKVELSIVAEATQRPLEFLKDGKLDVALVCNQFPDKRLQYRPLFSDEMVAIVHPDHPLARRSFLRAQDFGDQHLFLFSTPKETSLIFRQVLIPAGVSPRQVSYVQLTEAMVEMVKAGLGVSVLPRWTVAPMLKAGALKAVSIGSRGLNRHWFAATLKELAPGSPVLEFVDLLARHPISSRETTSRSA
jgi:LysR family transcriptional regulator for metE and metH